ncbi:MAG: 3-deoxy-manno-octulosonate cytidylyltransferase [Clostridia bacterium]|nr:3-deoxy-manno-octulosonate cytidylyltransferase [Clostridia bacterium]
MSEKIIGLIPTRMDSSRFPGKPIADICGKPMIYWVYEQAKKVDLIDELYVVTGDDIIVQKCREEKIPYIVEKRRTSTAAQKLSLVAESVEADIFLNIQGDEPLIKPEAIEQIIEEILKNQEVYYVGLRSKIKNIKEFEDTNIVKTIVDRNNYALYFSRSPIPYKFDCDNAYRVLGLYGYRKNFLIRFSSFPESNLEILECGVEMLKAMENGFRIKLVETEYNTIGVDLPEHIALIEKELRNRIF